MKNVFIENSVSSFEDFHDPEWVSDLLCAGDNAGCGELVENFATHWWGSSRAFILPWLLVTSVHTVVKENNPLISKSDLWEKYLKNNAFKSSLWKTAENTYCSIYYAYENLLVNLLSHISGKEKIRVTDRNFNSMVSGQFGESFTGNVWTSPNIFMAKEIRNSIVHNGGKATEKLLKMKNTPTIENGDVMISASDTRALYIYLKPLVNKLISAAGNPNAANKKIERDALPRAPHLGR